MRYTEGSAIIFIVATGESKTLHRRKLAHESTDEFLGRFTCEVEDAARKMMSLPRLAPLAAGSVRIAESFSDGHPIGLYFWATRTSYLECTGEPYVDRWRALSYPPARSEHGWRGDWSQLEVIDAIKGWLAVAPVR